MPTPVLLNRVRQTVAAAPGTGPVTLGPAVAGYRTFAAAGATAGALVNYVIEDGAAWEYGRGTYAASGPSLTRTSVLASSDGGAAISASAAATVFCDAFAEDVSNAFAPISATGDLGTTPAAAVTFTGLDAYTDLAFVFLNVSHDYTTANQTFSVMASTDGTAYSAALAFTPSISAAGQINGQALIVGNGQRRPVLRSGMVTGNVTEPGVVTAVENPRVLTVAAAITAIRFTPTAAGNFDAGTVTAYGR